MMGGGMTKAYKEGGKVRGPTVWRVAANPARCANA
jgi:hypothetical protein